MDYTFMKIRNDFLQYLCEENSKKKKILQTQHGEQLKLEILIQEVNLYSIYRKHKPT